MAGREIRSAALAFYSRVQKMRYAGGRFSYGRLERPMVVVDGQLEHQVGMAGTSTHSSVLAAPVVV